MEYIEIAKIVRLLDISRRQFIRIWKITKSIKKYLINSLINAKILCNLK